MNEEKRPGQWQGEGCWKEAMAAATAGDLPHPHLQYSNTHPNILYLLS